MIGGYFEPQVIMEAEGDKPTCVMCEYVLHKMQHWISDNKTEEELEAALEKVCGYMPKSVRGQCDNIVETYGKAIIEMMSSEVDPKEICSMMHLCDENSVLNHVELKGNEKMHCNLLPEMQKLSNLGTLPPAGFGSNFLVLAGFWC